MYAGIILTQCVYAFELFFLYVCVCVFFVFNEILLILKIKCLNLKSSSY